MLNLSSFLSPVSTEGTCLSVVKRRHTSGAKGPNPSSCSPQEVFGPIYAEAEVWGEHRRDNPQTAVGGMDFVAIVNKSYPSIKREMINFSTLVNSRKITYWPSGPNSNSYAFSFIEQLGVPRPRPRPGFWAAGWDHKL